MRNCRRCDHPEDAHLHYRVGTDCGLAECDCKRFRRPQRPRWWRPRPPSGLQLDLLSALVRLQQLGNLMAGVDVEVLAAVPAVHPAAADGGQVLARVLAYDMPRLWQYLDRRTVAWHQATGDDEPRLAVAWREREQSHRGARLLIAECAAFAAGAILTAYFLGR